MTTTTTIMAGGDTKSPILGLKHHSPVQGGGLTLSDLWGLRTHHLRRRWAEPHPLRCQGVPFTETRSSVSTYQVPANAGPFLSLPLYLLLANLPGQMVPPLTREESGVRGWGGLVAECDLAEVAQGARPGHVLNPSPTDNAVCKMGSGSPMHTPLPAPLPFQGHPTLTLCPLALVT